ncbi:MAG: iron chaperone [Microcella sp.]
MAEKTEGFSDAERAAMKARTDELRAEGRKTKGATKAAADLEKLLEAIAAMPDDERVIAERIHLIVSEVAPKLQGKTWYGMPAWALDGKVVCFFQAAGKFESRYNTFGFQDPATLDDGSMWPTSWAVTAIGPAEERLIRDLVARSVAGA